MTRTVLFADHAHADAHSIGKRTSPVSSFVSKALDAAQAMFTTSAVVGARHGKTSQPHSLLTANIRRNMSVRAQRLMRADY